MLAVWLGRLAMVNAMRVKVNISALPAPPYPETKTKPKNRIEIPKDVRIVRIETEPEAQNNPAPKKPRKCNRKDAWKDEEIDKAMEMYWQGKSYEDIAEALERTVWATKTKIFKTRRAKFQRPRPEPNIPNNNAWQVYEDEILIAMYRQRKSVEEIHKAIPTRSVSGIYQRAAALRNKGRL